MYPFIYDSLKISSHFFSKINKMDVFPLYSEQIFDKICYHEELYLKNEGICSHLITDHWLRNFCQIFATWVSDKKNICGHLTGAQFPQKISVSVRKFGGTQPTSLVDSELFSPDAITEIGLWSSRDSHRNYYKASTTIRVQSANVIAYFGLD